MSVKFQITLPEGLAHALKTAAARHGIPLAQFVRETMEDKLGRDNAANREDPFAWMDGLVFDSGETDVSSRVDEIVYGVDPHGGAPTKSRKA
jgi:hypothetical protein